MALTPGTRLGPYEIVAALGAGGMGEVYKARDSRLDRFAALKVLPGDKVADVNRKQRFVQEAKASSALNHPNVITVYDINADQGVDFIAMEFIAGRTLDQLIPRHGMRTPEVLRYGVQIADALAAAHAAGIIHRDLKPSNIMIADSGLVKVLDFGIAKLTEKAADPDQATRSMVAPATDEGSILGTIAYMSPEQAQGMKIDSRSDIFSFGAVFYEMLTGHPAFSGETKMSTLAAILEREPDPLASKIPRELDRVVSRCLKKSPGRRFQTMADLKVALEELKEESDSGRLTTVAGLPVRKASHWRLAAAAITIVAIAGAVAWRLTRTPAAPVSQKSELRQLTFDAGEDSNPTLSPDAKLVAYQSDRAGPGRFDIWVQQTAGGAPIRLTYGPADNRRPVFSGDGTKIYFESTGPPQGIYEVSALGGEPRLVAANATAVLVSPDGRNLVHVGRPSAQVFVVPASGGEPRALAPDFTVFGRAVWFQDSEYVAVFAQKTGEPETREWWRFPVAGGDGTRLNWVQWAGEHRYLGVPTFDHGDGGITTLARRAGENQQIYLVRNTPGTYFAIGEPVPITNGAAWSANASVAQGKMAFQSGTPETGLWSLAADTNAGRVTGQLQRINADKAVVGWASATPDGKTLAFGSNKTGSMDVFVRDMASGQERVITADAPEKSKTFALIDANATKVVYSMNLTRDISSFDVYEATTRGDTRRRICESCGPTLSLSPDGTQFLASQQDGPHSRINLIDVATGHSTVLLQHAQFPVSTARFSPDGAWVAFVVTRAPAAANVFMAPVHGTLAIPEAAWIQLTSAPGDIRQVFWSPDGRLVYYDVTIAGSTSLMSRSVERGTPTGAAAKVYEFTGRIRPASSFGGGPFPIPDTLNAVPGGFVGVLEELSYNIWLMDLPSAFPK